jgi:hypothetical protein
MASSRQSREPVNQTSRDTRSTVERQRPVGGLRPASSLT